MTRAEEIAEAIKERCRSSVAAVYFKCGAEWADAHQPSPWISVEERLPKKLENDCTSDYVLTKIEGPRHVWYLVNKYNYDIKAWEGCNNNTIQWMPIPTLIKE